MSKQNKVECPNGSTATSRAQNIFAHNCACQHCWRRSKAQWALEYAAREQAKQGQKVRLYAGRLRWPSEPETQFFGVDTE